MIVMALRMAFAALRWPAPVSAIRNSIVLPWPFNGSFPLYQTEKGARKIAPFHLSPLFHVPMGATHQPLLFRQVKPLPEALHTPASIQNPLLSRNECRP